MHSIPFASYEKIGKYWGSKLNMHKITAKRRAANKVAKRSRNKNRRR